MSGALERFHGVFVTATVKQNRPQFASRRGEAFVIGLGQ
jgi:hypothetical protein